MKKVLLTVLLVVLFAFGAYAETEVNFDGQVRVRGELDRKSFDPNQEHFQAQTFMRTRFGVSAVVDGNAEAYVQFQDSRVLGSSGQSGSLGTFENIDLHQAFLKVNRVFVDGLGFKAGRFEVNFGNQRVFGAVGWHNVGRSWEGFMGWYKGEKYTLNFFDLKKFEMNDGG